jgi:hypothetical protein
MIEQLFTLIPFEAPHIPALSLSGKLSLEDRFLNLQYSLAGETESILLPPASLVPSRKDELWKATCFEFFLAIRDQPGYWEFNMSPSGDWNVYRMDAYRRIGFREEAAIADLPFEIKKTTDGFFLDVAVDLTFVSHSKEELQMGITAILQTKEGGETYWALAHPAPYADFHLRESFTLSLAGQTHPLGQAAQDG